MSYHFSPAVLVGGVVAGGMNLLAQVAVATDNGLAAWGVFVTTVCGGLVVLMKTYWDGKARAAATAEALAKAALLQRQVDEFEARHRADMAWVQQMSEYLNGRIDRSRERVTSLSEQVQVITGSSDSIVPMDTAGDMAAVPKPMPEAG